MPQSLSKKSKDLLLDLVNDKNQSELVHEDVDFADPAVQTANDRNSNSVISAKPDSQYTGEVTVEYDRLDLQKLFTDAGMPVVELNSLGLTSSLDLLTELNLEYGLALDEDDIVVEALPTGLLPQDYTLKVKATSFAWLNQLAIRLTDGKPPLSSVIVQTVLDGLKYPTGDVTSLTRPEIAFAAPVAEAFQTPEGTLLVGTGNPVGDLIVATNSEIEVAVGARRYRDAVTIPPTDGAIPSYAFSIADSGDWNFMFLAGMKDKTKVLDLTGYRLTLAVVTQDLSHSMRLQFVENEDGSHSWKEVDATGAFVPNGINVTDAYIAEDGTVTQEIQRLSFYAGGQFPNFEGLTKNSAGAVLGDFTLSLEARRLDSIAPRVLAQANVSITAEEAPQQ